MNRDKPVFKSKRGADSINRKATSFDSTSIVCFQENPEMRNIFKEMMKFKIKADKFNIRTTSYSVTNIVILKLLESRIPLTLENINQYAIEYSLKHNRQYNPKRTAPHVFDTRSNACLNGTMTQMGYRLRQFNNRICMIREKDNFGIEL